VYPGVEAGQGEYPALTGIVNSANIPAFVGQGKYPQISLYSHIMPLPSFRSSRSKVRRRRSHHALKAVSTMQCAACGATLLPHRACKACGKYGDRSVKKTGMDEVKKVLKKTVKSDAAETAPKAEKKPKAVKAPKAAAKKAE
jgi:large subunit ribosomal protein L32